MIKTLSSASLRSSRTASAWGSRKQGTTRPGHGSDPARTTPAFSWISPNLCDDGHDCGVSAGDRFLARTVPALLRALGPHGFLVITWDEGTSDRGCCGAAHGGHIATILAGPDVRRGARERRPVDHYGVLATIERAFGLTPLAGAADPRAGDLTPLFSRPPRGLR